MQANDDLTCYLYNTYYIQHSNNNTYNYISRNTITLRSSMHHLCHSLHVVISHLLACGKTNVRVGWLEFYSILNTVRDILHCTYKVIVYHTNLYFLTNLSVIFFQDECLRSSSMLVYSTILFMFRTTMLYIRSL